MKHYKSIAEALPHERPGDKVVQIIDNKFAIIQSLFTDGTYDKNKVIMYLYDKTIYSFCNILLARNKIKVTLSWPNVERSTWCMDHSKNGKPSHYVTYWTSNRRLKKTARRLLRALDKHNL